MSFGCQQFSWDLSILPAGNLGLLLTQAEAENRQCPSLPAVIMPPGPRVPPQAALLLSISRGAEGGHSPGHWLRGPPPACWAPRGFLEDVTSPSTLEIRGTASSCSKAVGEGGEGRRESRCALGTWRSSVWLEHRALRRVTQILEGSQETHDQSSKLSKALRSEHLSFSLESPQAPVSSQIK